MSISVSDKLQLFAQEVQRFLSPNILRDIARDVGFVQRTSKYQAKDLVALCVWMSTEKLEPLGKRRVPSVRMT